MPATATDLHARFKALGINVTTHQHPAVFTVEEASQHTYHLPGGHCKNLFLRDRKKRNWLVVAHHATTIDLKALSERLDTRQLTLGRPERLGEVLGVIPGAVTPFALINDPDCQVQVVVEQALLDYELLNFHPLTNDATTAIRPDDLLAFIRAGGHGLRVIAL